MKLAVLSRAPHCYSTRRLVFAAEQRGHSVRVLNTLRFAIDLTSNAPDLQYRGRPLPDYDAVLPRIGASITYFGTAVVRQFEQMDVFTPNTSNGILNSRDKLRSLQVLSRHDLSIPPPRRSCGTARMLRQPSDGSVGRRSSSSCSKAPRASA